MININYFLFISILILTIGISSLINYFIFIYKIKKMNIVHEKDKFDLDKNKYTEYEQEKKKILTNITSEINDAYDKGFNEGFKRAELNSKIITLLIKPWENEIIKNGFFNKTVFYQLGYQYILLINGIPALSPYQIVDKTIKLSQANEDNIKEVISQVKDSVDKAINAAGGLVTFSGDFQKIQDNLIKRIQGKNK